MGIKFNRKHLQDLLKAGKIRGIVETTAIPDTLRGPRPDISRGDGPKAWIDEFLTRFAKEQAYLLEREFRFHETRKWRLDWAMRAPKLGIEYEGLSYQKTGHTTSEGYTANTDKYNTAAALGWTIFRVTYLNYTSLPTQLVQWIKTTQNGK